MQRTVVITWLGLMFTSGLAWAGGPGTPAPLSQAEIDGLLYMREEEKLARDVYQALYAEWESPAFANIAVSEQQHMDSILALICWVASCPV